tara:strand:+ start:613 stop:777 length:165 start_codon:yes stop_codon:yes gene_type:complete
MAGIINRVAKKQVPTPINNAIPILPNPLYVANHREPKPNMVVSDVSRIAFPVDR